MNPTQTFDSGDEMNSLEMENPGLARTRPGQRRNVTPLNLSLLSTRGKSRRTLERGMTNQFDPILSLQLDGVEALAQALRERRAR